MSSTTLQTVDLEALNSRSSTAIQSAKEPIEADLKVPISPLLLVLEVCNVKPSYRFDLGPLQCQTRIQKLVSAYKTNLLVIMGWESSDMARFDLGPFHQGQTRVAKLNRANNLLITSPRGLQCEPKL